jgi:hypothetical protein
LNVFSIGPCEVSTYQPRRRLSPTNLIIGDEALSSTGDKFTGRVTKNTGLKKYNQRQLREMVDSKNISKHLKTEASYDKSSFLPSNV